MKRTIQTLAMLIAITLAVIWIVGCAEEEKGTVAAGTKVTTSNKDGAEMALIPAGEFQMGDHFNEGGDNERPVHTVYIDAFYIDKYEVTNALYKKFLASTGH